MWKVKEMVDSNIAVNEAVRVAQNLPALESRLEQVDPDIRIVRAKSLLYSKTVWGSLAAIVVSRLATQWGLGWDVTTCSVVSGAIVWIAVIALRYVTKAPIDGMVATTGDAAKAATPSGTLK